MNPFVARDGVATETVEVPTGTFRCHRIEVEVDIPLLRPKIVYWLSVEPPHFLVRHRGKRGLFTPEYETLLRRVGRPGGP